MNFINVKGKHKSKPKVQSQVYTKLIIQGIFYMELDKL